eukprot:TRINITY_DN36802_c0_g1_i4.p1 TRINITY_DN36802_c0_g1~~TRINITY_DN36802_c0_g1_i4.p1  ORF type:complete len:2056 (+),score=611.93 TRINITY_DN36802_c0_g1_i4:690-6857(+)
MEDPTDHDCVTMVCSFTTKTDYGFTGLFTVECIVKIVGLGFLRPKRGAYIRDEWNVLDFLIVVTGDAALAVDVFFGISGPGLTGLRAFRLLRPLKAVQAFPAVRVLVQSILESLPKLLDVCVLYGFFLLVMGIVSVQQFKGLLRWRCVDESTVNSSAPVVVDDRVCATHGWTVNFGGHHCDWGQVCLQVAENPHNGKVGFDNIGIAALTLFTALTLEGWTEVLYEVIDGTTYFAALFFVILIIFGAFFILNLTIVIITEAFEMKQFAVKTAAFRAIDADGGGELDKDEVRMLLKKLTGERPSEEYLDKVFGEMDEDGGGTVSMEEFLAYTATHPSLASSVIAGRSTTGGLARDVERIAGRCPCITKLRNSFSKFKEYVTRPRERSAGQDAVFQVVADSRTHTQRPTAKQFFNRFIMWCILLNTLVLACEHYEAYDWLEDTLWWLNTVFTMVFAGECVLKLYGLGPQVYFRDNWNAFDFVIVALSLVDLIFGDGGGGVSAFRAFRVLRVLKLARQVPLLQRWIGILISSMKAAAILTALLGLVIFIVALLGMQLFGGQLCFMDDDWDPDARGVTAEMRVKGMHCGGVPRSNYDTVWAAFITTFQILTGEDWNVVMYTGMRTSGDAVSLYFCIYYVLGNYMMLNLFIAVLLNNRDLKDTGSQVTNRTSEDGVEGGSEPPESPAHSPEDGGVPGSPTAEWKRLAAPTEAGSEPGSPVARGSPVLAAAAEEKAGLSDGDTLLAADARRLRRTRSRSLAPGCLKRYMERGNSFCIFGEDNKVRLALARVSSHGCFELLVLLAIAVSTCSLAVEDPIMPPDHRNAVFLAQVDFVMVWIFLAECVFKSVSYGLVLHPDSYLRREGWNRLDFVIVVVSTLSVLIPGGDRISLVKIVRTLRPLRFINKSKGMKVVVQALLRSIKPLSNVLVISFVVWLIFGILGVQSFGGMFYRCGLDDYGDQETEDGRERTVQGRNASFIYNASACLDRAQCEGTDGRPCRWINNAAHFDHIFAAFLTLFEVSSLEGWVGVMYLGADSVGEYQAPRRNSSPLAVLYFLIFVVFGAFFIINMFIGVLIDTYYSEKEKAQEEGKKSMFSLDDEQLRWVEQHHVMVEVLSDKHFSAGDAQQELRHPQLHFILSPMFDGVITACIVLNVIAMAMEHHPQSDVWDTALETANMAFFIIFALEAALKIVGLGLGQYLSDVWNRFDFFIVCTSLAGLLLSLVVSVGPITGVFRIMRLARMLRMVKRAKGIQRILRTLYISLPSLINVAGILFLLFFIYAVLGVKLFGKIKRGPNMGPYANLENFGFAMLLLLRVSTGEAWQTLMDDLRTMPPDCEPRLDNCSGHTLIAPFYFCTFVLSGMYILLNLFIAVILDAFSEAASSDGPETKVTKGYMELARVEWEKRAMMTRGDSGPGCIAKDHLHDFLRAVGPPLGPFNPNELSQKKLEYWLMPVDLCSDQFGMINQTELFSKLFANYVRRLVGDDKQRLAQWEELRSDLDQKHQQQTRQRILGDATAPSLSGYLAAARMQALLKGWVVRRHLSQLGLTAQGDRPKRPLSAWCRFMTEEWEATRERMQLAADADHALRVMQLGEDDDEEPAKPPEVPPESVARRLYQIWRWEMSEEEKRPFREQAAADGARHERELREWRARNPSARRLGRAQGKGPPAQGLSARRKSLWARPAAAPADDASQGGFEDTLTSLDMTLARRGDDRAALLEQQLRAQQQQIEQLESRLRRLSPRSASDGSSNAGTGARPVAELSAFRVGQPVRHPLRGSGTVASVTPAGLRVAYPSGDTRAYPPDAVRGGCLLAHRQRAAQSDRAEEAETPLLSAAATPVTGVLAPQPQADSRHLSGTAAGAQHALYRPPPLPLQRFKLPKCPPERPAPDHAPAAPPARPPTPPPAAPPAASTPRGEPPAASAAAERPPQGSPAARSSGPPAPCRGAAEADLAARLVSEYDMGRDGGLDFAEFRQMCFDLGLPGPRTEAEFAAVCSRHGIRTSPGFGPQHISGALRQMQPAQQLRVRAFLGRAAAAPSAHPPATASRRGRLARGSGGVRAAGASR